MLHRQTEQYLKTNQIKHSSLYNKAFFKSSRQCFLLPDRLHKFSIDAISGYSFLVENKSCSADLDKDRDVNLAFTPGRFQKSYKSKRTGGSIEISSERINRSEEILKELQQKIKILPQQKFEREGDKKTRMALKKLKNEIMFENELLTKPIPNEYFPKIKLTKRKFRAPKSREVSAYCPWVNEQEDIDNSFQHNI